ncbi:MAG: hypothetical protein DRZ82_08245 [Thermoprotei archaeon]|nr:MAG: hypothetical protein DRZ82_08245 [Thermoprotei archaeon]
MRKSLFLGCPLTQFGMSIAGKREVMLYYDILSRGYDELYGEEQSEKYREIFKNVKLRGIVADLGCGTGLLIGYMKRHMRLIVWYVGLDISKGMIERALEKRDIMLNADLIQGDIEYLPFRNDIFDTVVSITVLQNVLSPHKVVKEIERVTKGKVIISILRAAENSRAIMKEFNKYFHLERMMILKKDVALVLKKEDKGKGHRKRRYVVKKIIPR